MAIFYQVIEYLLGFLFTKDRRKGDEKMTDEAILIFDRISRLLYHDSWNRFIRSSMDCFVDYEATNYSPPQKYSNTYIF